MKWKHGRRIVIAAIGCIALVGTVFVWRSRLPEKPGVVAVGLIDATFEADGAHLLRYALPEEIEANKLSPQKISRLFNEVILPRFPAGASRVTLDVKESPWQGVATAGLQLTDGKLEHFAIDTFPHAGRPRTSITQLVFRAWSSSYARKMNTKLDKLSMIDAVLEGVRQDRATLDAIGITSLASVEYSSSTITMIPVAEIETRYNAWRISVLASATEAAK